MECRSCGTTIADKAIICFRCGAPTTVPAAPRRAGAERPSGPGVWVLVVSGLLAAGIVAVGYQLGDWMRALWVALVVDALITAWWVWRRTAGR